MTEVVFDTFLPRIGLYDDAGQTIPLDADLAELTEDLLCDLVTDFRIQLAETLEETQIKQVRRLVLSGNILVAEQSEAGIAHTLGLTSRGLPELALSDYPHDNYLEVLTSAAQSIVAHGRPAHRATLCGVGCRDHPFKTIVPDEPITFPYIHRVYAGIRSQVPEVMAVVTPGPDGLFDWETPFRPSRSARRRASRRGRSGN